MKKWHLSIAAGLMCALLLTGCLPEGAGLQGGGLPAPTAPPNASSPQAESTRLKVMLPVGHEALAELLENLAGADGLKLEVSAGRAGAYYAEDVQTALDSEDAPDVVWLNNEAEFADLNGPARFLDFLAGADVQLCTLAVAVPGKLRTAGESKVYGLPAGYLAQGYLVNLELLAALLGTENRQALLEDLTVCGFEQWRLMLTSLSQYLQRPGRMQITLGESRYITPGLRPASARGLRGVFALPDAESEALLEGAFTAALNPPFSGSLSVLMAGEEEKTAQLYPMLGSLLSLLEFETGHMARKEGELHRGEDYAAVWEKLSLEGAQELFYSGTALLLRADAATGLWLEAQHPELEGRLALVPVKLPLVVKEEDAARETEPEENAETADEAPVDVMLELAKHNRRLWVASGGAFYVVKKEEGYPATPLFLRLFGTRQGADALAGLGFVPFSVLIQPESGLRAQVQAAVAGPGALLPVQPAAWARAQGVIGAFVRDELMNKEDWREEEIDRFFTTAAAALGLRLENVPQLEDGRPLNL